ncbi:unnamed protein product [Paramecium pentaurelia]|uniref:Uncharacterized protein n=1 Tax=Paramecium pentaurelia TaxID=43138 RepID=A0A8S1T026_9CILI|nr:unnamed protein product [Paramecium pentaurelia]
MINSQSVPNLQNSSALPISEPTLEQINKKQYGDTLRQQIEQKKIREQQERIQERLMELQLQNPLNNYGRGGGGAPLRDQYGNITTTRRNPMDPNMSSAQIFGPSISSVQFNQPEYLSASQLPIQTQRLVTSNQSMIHLPTSNNSMNQSQLSHIGEQIAQAEKKQKQFVLQRELISQMEIAERKKQEEKLKIKRDKELDDLRILREREEIERRMKDEFGIDKLEKRNLQQTNFDIDGLKALKRLEMLRYQNELIEQQNRKNAKTGVRQRTPIQEAEKAYRDQRNDILQSRIEQRIIKELPIEVEKTVRDTINVELNRLRQEMNLQTNQVSEQVVSLKSHLMKANEQRHYNEEQIRKLKEELRSTQIIDDIRQRELYQAFLNQEKTRQIIESAQRQQTPDQIKYTFPRRQKLNYNSFDPFLGNNDDVNKDLYEIITDNTQIGSVSQNFQIGLNNQNKEKILDQRLQNEDDDVIINRRSGQELKNNEFDLQEDYQNRQQLYIAKSYLDSKPINNYDYTKIESNSIIPKSDYVSLISSTHPYYIQEEDEIKDVIQRYSNKLDRLDDIDVLQQKRDFNQMDYALQDLLDQQTNKLNKNEYINDPIDYNDYYSTDYQETNFYNKMNKLS